MTMRKLLTAAMLAAGIAGYAGSALATPISGSIDIGGLQASHTSTTINFQSPAGIDSVSGSFSELGTCSFGAGPPLTGCVVMAASLSMPPTTPSFQLFTATHNNNTVVFDVTSDHFSALAAGGVQITGMGIVGLTGFSDTTASFSLTVPGNGRGASFDLFTQVPEPGTLALFAAGLLGCAIFVGRRRRSTSASV